MHKHHPGIFVLLIFYALTARTATLEEVVVTAELRNTPLLNEPASTSIVTASDLQQRAAQQLEDALNVAPNTNFASGTSRTRFFQLRGIGERSQFQEPLNPSVGLLIDGIDFSGLGLPGTLFDIDQVEILRGPRGTLHGANALAGLINIRSGEPRDEPGMTAQASAADYGTWNAGLVGTGPLIQNRLLYRLAVSTHRSDGFIRNDYLQRNDTNNRDEIGVRGKLRWLSGDTSVLDLTASYADVDNGYDTFSLDNTRHTLSDQPGHDRLKSSALGLNWHSEGDGATVETALTLADSDTDYGYDEDWSYVGIAPGWEYSSFDRYQRNRDSYSAQLRLLSSDKSQLFGGSTAWVTGFYYLADHEQLRRSYTYLQADFRSHYDTDTLALFGQLNTDLGERLTLVSGLRLERRKTDYRDNNAVDSDPQKNLWGGRVTLEYRTDDGVLLYGGVSRGYRANGVNATILASAGTSNSDAPLKGLEQYGAEHLLNYELGAKGSFMADTLHARMALFYMDRQDQQVKGSLVIPRDDGSTAFIDYTSNAASGNNYGLELELDWLATQSLSLHANVGLLQTEFDDYINADGTDLSGREQAQAPSYQYALGGRFDIGHGVYFRLDAEGKNQFFLSDRHSVKAPDYDLLHLRLGYDRDRWSLAIWVRNVTDEDYVVRGFGSFGNDPRKEYSVEPYFEYGAPRLFGVSASYKR